MKVIVDFADPRIYSFVHSRWRDWVGRDHTNMSSRLFLENWLLQNYGNDVVLRIENVWNEKTGVFFLVKGHVLLEFKDDETHMHFMMKWT